MKLNKYTPIKCHKTNVALNLGDKVKDLQHRCGTLEWDDCFNQYYIKPIGGGKIKTQQYVKIEKLFNIFNSFNIRIINPINYSIYLD